MNGRIKELSRQAWEWAEQQEYKDATQEFSDILEQKFAELVVQECLQMADEFEIDVNRSGLVDRMKYHFGFDK
jgi:hypothetical protein